MELKDWLNSINFNKENLIKGNTYIVKEYPSFIINKCLSGHLDCIMFANEMNKCHFLDKDLQYEFYLNILRREKDSLLGSVRIKSPTLIVSNNTMVTVMRKRLKH